MSTKTAKQTARETFANFFNPSRRLDHGCDTLQIDPGDELREECSTLPRGAHLIAASRVSVHADDRHLWVFLCALETSDGVEFVTWRANDGRTGEIPGCYLRSDYDTAEQAVAGFHARARR